MKQWCITFYWRSVISTVVRCLVSVFQEVERNLHDAMQVCRNVLLDSCLLPGGGAVEMAVSHRLMERSRALTGVEQWPYRAVAQALEVIPRTLIQNCGASTIRVLTSLRVSLCMHLSKQFLFLPHTMLKDYTRFFALFFFFLSFAFHIALK